MAVMGLESGGLGVGSCVEVNGCRAEGGRTVTAPAAGVLQPLPLDWEPIGGKKSQGESSAHLESILSPKQPQT